MVRTRRLFLALFGLTAAVAVGSFWWQLPGLSGSHGIEPAAELMAAAHRTPDATVLDVPTLAWLSADDWALHGLCALAFLASLGVAAALAPRVCLVVLWVSWRSLTAICHPWLGFQWDLLLGESAFWAVLFAPPGLRPGPEAPPPSRASRFILQLLACKLTFESGVVKLASGDPAWTNLTALTWHWWTQPLPTWTSALAYQLPLVVQMALCALVFFFELPVPLLALGGRGPRRFAAAGLVGLQLALGLTGNYAYYTALTIALAVPLLDDQAWARRAPPPPDPARPSPAWQWALAAAYGVLSVLMFLPRLHSAPGWGWLRVVQATGTVNGYGAFAVMTTERTEVRFEGSADGVEWKPYGLPFKPGDVTRRPRFVAPWQPRLDWQLWFAGLGDCSANPWVLATSFRLLQGAPEVLALFDGDPFPAAPPRYLRTRAAAYRFAPWSAAGVWWEAKDLGPYCPTVMLDAAGRLARAPQ